AGLDVHQDGAVVERAHQKDRHRGHRFAVGLGADVGGDRHLADVEVVAAHHAAERGDEGIDLLEIEGEGARFDGAVLERLVVALAAGDGFELEFGHDRIASLYSRVSSPLSRQRASQRRANSIRLFYTVVWATTGRVVSASLATSLNA